MHPIPSLLGRLRPAGTLPRALGVAWLLVMGVAPGPGPLLGQGAPPGAIQGRVLDESGIPISSALVRLFRPGSELALRGAETDDLGYYHMEPLGAGPYRVDVLRLGFAAQSREIEVPSGTRLDVDFTLVTQALALEGINVEAERSRERVRFEEEAGLTVRELARDQIKGIPGLVEADPLRAVEVLPGVVTTSDFSSAFNVRGGSADQNLILLDGLPVFNPTHLGGFFSIFNGDMVRRAELQSGGFPARFGGRVSSVLDVQSDPGAGQLRWDAGVSLLATRVALAGGVGGGVLDKLRLRSAGWRVSGRRSYFDQVLKPFFDFPYHLTDLQAAFEGWTLGGDRISLTAYTGRDVLDLTTLDAEDFPLRIDWDWGNDLLGLRWTRPRRDGGSWEVRTGYSRFRSGLSFPDFDDTEIRSGISLGNLEGDLELRPTPYLAVTTGGGIRRLAVDNLFETGGTVFGGGKGTGRELFGYLQAEWNPTADWILEVGGRVEKFEPSAGEDVTVFSPRVSVKRFLPGSEWALKASAGRYAQFLHSIRDEELPVGLDVWILTGDQAPQVVSDQLQLGLEGYPREGWYGSLEAFYRVFDGVVTTNLAEDPNREGDNYLPGRGLSYGADLFIRRTRGATTGWLALSLLRADRSFPDFLSGLDPAPEITYAPVFDRRVDADLVLQRSLGRGLEAGLRWNFGTGLPYTRPLGSYVYLSPRIIPGSQMEWSSGSGEEGEETDGFYGVALSDRNGARYPARHRLDLSLRWTVDRSWGRMTPYVTVLNVYNRKNVLFYFFQYDLDPPMRTGISMFPFLPTLGVEVTF